MNLVVRLSTEIKYRNKHEYRPINVATLEVGDEVFVSKGDGFNIQNVCKQALEFKPELGGISVEVMRGSRKVYIPHNLRDFAYGKHMLSGKEQPAQLKRVQEDE